MRALILPFSLAFLVSGTLRSQQPEDMAAFLGEWEDRTSWSQPFRIQVTWNTAEQQLEGTLTLVNDLQSERGLSAGDLMWTARKSTTPPASRANPVLVVRTRTSATYWHTAEADFWITVLDARSGRFDSPTSLYDYQFQRASGPPAARPAAASSAQKWKDRAGALLESPQRPGSPPNQAVTCAYADLYRGDEAGLFKWAGLAALVSGQVGRGLAQTQDADFPGVDDAAFRNSVLEGNRQVFDDLFWQHLAYSEGGLAEIERLFREDAIDESVREAWHKIDRGDAWEGNLDLLLHEQRDVLQAMYDAHDDAWWWANTWLYDVVQWFRGGPQLVSPVPGHGDHFDENIADFADRWRWIEESVWPEWQRFELDPENAERLRSALDAACPP